jgi:hypothetical protein
MTEKTTRPITATKILERQSKYDIPLNGFLGEMIKQARIKAMEEYLEICNDFSTKYFNASMEEKLEELKSEDRDRRFGFDVTGNVIQYLIDKEKGE